MLHEGWRSMNKASGLVLHEASQKSRWGNEGRGEPMPDLPERRIPSDCAVTRKTLSTTARKLPGRKAEEPTPSTIPSGLSQALRDVISIVRGCVPFSQFDVC